jgi:hypothetical protein
MCIRIYPRIAGDRLRQFILFSHAFAIGNDRIFLPPLNILVYPLRMSIGSFAIMVIGAATRHEQNPSAFNRDGISIVAEGARAPALGAGLASGEGNLWGISLLVHPCLPMATYVDRCLQRRLSTVSSSDVSGPLCLAGYPQRRRHMP